MSGLLFKSTFQLSLQVQSVSLVHEIPYAAKISGGKTFAVFAIVQPTTEVFPTNSSFVETITLQFLRNRKCFPANCNISMQP